jgi:hypothetical protein
LGKKDRNPPDSDLGYEFEQRCHRVMLLIGGIFTGSAIATSGRFPRWAGWLYAITVASFALSVFFFSSAQSLLSTLLFAATVAVAWSASREGGRQSYQAGMPIFRQKRIDNH